MGLFSKARGLGDDILDATEDVGSTVAKAVAKEAKKQAPRVARRAKKVGRGAAREVFKRGVKPAYESGLRPFGEKVLIPGMEDYEGIGKRVGAEMYMWYQEPQTLPFNPFISKEEADRIKHERGLSVGLGGMFEDMFTDAGRKRVDEKGFKGASALEKIGFQILGDPLTWTGIGAVRGAAMKGLASGSLKTAAVDGMKEAAMQTGIPSIFKVVTAPARIPSLLARGKGARLTVGIDAAAEALKDVHAARFVNLSDTSRAEELAKLDDWKYVANEISKTGKGTSKIDGQTYTANQLRDVYDNWTQSERIVSGGGLDNADYLRRLRDNRPLLDINWMTNAAKEARTVFAHEGDDISTLEKLGMKVPGFRNVLSAIAPARYRDDPVVQVAVQRLAAIHNIRASTGVMETLHSMNARAAGMLRDPFRGTVKNVTARGKLEPTVTNILERPDLFDMPDRVRDVVDAHKAAQRAVGRSIGEQALAFAEQNPGVIGKEDLKWYKLLAEGRDDYVHRKVAWATSVPEGARRYTEGTYEANPIRRLAAFLRVPGAGKGGRALPGGFHSVPTTPVKFGVKPSITYERVVTSAADAKNVLYSQDPGVILADYNNQLFQKFLDDTVYGPILKKLKIDPNSLISTKFDADIGVLMRTKSKLGRLNAVLTGIRDNKAVSKRTVAYLRGLAANEDLPEELRIALEGDAVRADNLLDAMHAENVSSDELARRLSRLGSQMEEEGTTVAGQAKLRVKRRGGGAAGRAMEERGQRAQEVAEAFGPATKTHPVAPLPGSATGKAGLHEATTGAGDIVKWKHERGDVTHFINVAVPEEAQKSGRGAALMQYVIDDAIKNGSKTLTADIETEQGARLFQRYGATFTDQQGNVIDAVKAAEMATPPTTPEGMARGWAIATIDLTNRAPGAPGPTIKDALVAAHQNLVNGVRVRLAEVKAAMEGANVQLGTLRADKAAAKDAATRGSWSMRHITTPGLNGWYDEKVGEAIQQYFGMEQRGDNILQQATLYQSIPQSLMAGADVSASLLQTVVTAFTNPVGWLKGLGYGLASFSGQGNRFYAGYLRGLARNIEPVSGKSWLELATRGNLSMSGTELFDMTEYLHAIGASGRKLSAVSEFIANMPQNRAFSIQRNVAALELYKAQVGLEQIFSKGPLTDDTLKSIGRQVDLATGVVSSQKLGVQPTQASIERMFGRFGVQWFRSQTGRLVQAFRTGSVDGRVARRLLTQQIAGMLATYIAATTLAGQEPNLDPTSRDFLTIKVGKSRIRPGGIFVSTVRTFAQTVDAVASGDAEKLTQIRSGNNPILNFWRNGAPVLGGLIADEIFDVNKDASYRAGEYGQFDPRRYMPFSAQAALSPNLQNPTLLDRFIAGGSSAVGLTESPQTPTDIWKAVTSQYAAENGFASWDAIPEAQQETIINQMPEIAAAKLAVEKWYAKRGDTPLGAAMKQNEQSRMAMGDVLAGAWARVQTGQMTKAEWRQLYGEWSGKHTYLTQNVFDSLPTGARKELDKDKALLQDRLADQFQSIQPVDLDGDGDIGEDDWKAWREARAQFWAVHPEAQQYAEYIQFEYPVKVWEKIDNPVMKEADMERRRAGDKYDEYLSIAKYRGLSKEDGDFLDALISAKSAASREIGAMMAERGVPPERIRVPAALAWKYVVKQLQASGMPATARNQQLLRLAVAVSADEKRKMKLLSPARLNFLKQNADVLDWYPSALRDTGLSTNMLVRLGVIQQPQGETVASRAAAMLQ